jgi:uncharacterized protein with PQ loop repeat
MRHIHRLHAHKRKQRDVPPTLMWIAAISSPLATLPQIISIYQTHNVHGVSLTTWLLFALTPLVWLTYGLIHKDKFIIVNNALWSGAAALVFVGILLFQ